MAALGKLSGIVEVAVNLVFVLVVRVLRAEHRGTYGAGKVFDMVFAFQGSDVRATEGATAGMT